MRIKKGFVLRELAGEKIISGEGLEQIDFNKIVTLNTSAAYIWEHISNREFDLETMVDLLLDRYDIERSVDRRINICYAQTVKCIYAFFCNIFLIIRYIFA